MSEFVRRFDFVTKTGNIEKTSQGFLKVPITVVKAGVYPYRIGGKLRHELLPLEEIERPETMATLQNMPLTNDHPQDLGRPEANGLVSPKNFQELAVGFTGDEVKKRGMLAFDVVGLVTHDDAITDVNNGKTAISPGRLIKLKNESGIWKDPETQQEYTYDAIQTNLIFNHIALVDQGREGPDVKIRLDAGDGIQENLNHKQTKTREAVQMKFQEWLQSLRMDSAEGVLSTAKKIKEAPVNQGDAVHGEPEKVGIKIADAPSYDVHKDVADYIGKVQDCMGKVVDAHDDLKEKHDKLNAHMEEMKGMLAKKEEGEKTSEKKMDSLKAELLLVKSKIGDKKALLGQVNARIELTTKAKSLIGAEKFTELKLDEADDLEIKKAVIKARNDQAVLDDKSADFIEGQFQTLATDSSSTSTNGEEIGRVILDAAHPEKTMDQITAERIAKNKEKWKTPIGATKENANALTNEAQGTH